MRVVFNCLATLRQKTGVGHYADELFGQLVRRAAPDRIHGFPGPWIRPPCRAGVWAYERLRPGGARGGTPDARAPSGWSVRLARRARRLGLATLGRRFATACRRLRFDLYHEPNFIPFPTDLPTVVTLHDLSVLAHPEWHPADRVAHYERHFRDAVARCAHFLTVSEFSRREVVCRLGISPDRVTRVYNGIRAVLRRPPLDDVQRTLRRLRLPPRYLLCVGTIEPRKNLLLLLRAYCALPEGLRAGWPLVLVGRWGWGTQPVARYLDETARHRGVHHVGYIPDRDLGALYTGARALLYPSLYEGFGLPPLEMLACGGAVLASTAGALVETVGTRAYLLDPRDENGWSCAMKRVITDDGWWESLRHRAEEAARPYTWARCAEETLAVYRSLVHPIRLPAPPPPGLRRAAG